MTPAIAPYRRPASEPVGHGWWPYFDQHRDMDMPPQSQSWTCSACSIDWVARATNLDPDSNREKVVGGLGYPNCINADVGLADTQCAVDYMRAWDVPVLREWFDFDHAYDVASHATGLLNSTTWQHFVAIRGTSGPDIWVANSARGYRGIYDLISRAQWDLWAGSWQVVYLVP